MSTKTDTNPLFAAVEQTGAAFLAALEAAAASAG